VNEDRVTIERRGLRLDQPGGNEVLLFTLSPDEVMRIADIARIGRGDQGELIGYQRPEVRGHVNDIRTYLEGDDVVFPHALIIALAADCVRFRGSRGPKTTDGLATAGTVEITVDPENKPGWLVDGQQRALALRGLGRTDLPVPITAFVTDDLELQRDQFIRINNTKPLPRGLVTELLPSVAVPISSKLSTKKLPSALCDQLHRHEDSPFEGLIRRPSSSAEERQKAVITDTSIVKMLEESLRSSSGCLFPYRNVATGEADLDSIWAILTTYWTAVRDTFPEAWGLPPQRSRLMGGAGIRSMGRLMDKIMATVNPLSETAVEQARHELARVAPICRWTRGTWDGLAETPVAWNAVENTPRDVSALSNLLIRSYVTSRMAA
jgi:DGQHR domain-containing protein